MINRAKDFNIYRKRSANSNR